jgi:limonene-1,2-epoxide hydrolase
VLPRVHEVVGAFLTDVESRDIEVVLACFADDLSYENVPHGAVRGKDGLRGLLGPFLSRCEGVRWDVVSSATSGDRTFVERVDRFWIDGVEYKIECTGVYRVRSGLIAQVRDYVDLGVWRERLGSVMER